MKTKKRIPRIFQGLRVVDASQPMVLHITKSDINNSDKKSPENCAAARACKREYKKEVRVFLTRTYVKDKDHWTRYLNPERVTREIISFDRNATFEPGVYKILPASEAAKLGVHRGQSTHKSEKTQKQARNMTANVRSFDKK